MNKLFNVILLISALVLSVTSCKNGNELEKVAVTGVSLDVSEKSIIVGDSFTLIATVSPDNATNKAVTWSSSNSAVATVTEGKVTGVSAGTATITVTTADGNKTATCKVTVTSVAVAVTGVSLDVSEKSIIVGDSFTLIATVSPDNATNKTVTWSSSNSAVATVTEDKVTGVSAGTATITVTTADGNKTATCKVTVISGQGDLVGEVDFDALVYLGNNGAGPGENYYYGLVINSKGRVVDGEVKKAGYKYTISLIRDKKAPIAGLFIPTFAEYTSADIHPQPMMSFNGKQSKIEYWESDTELKSTKSIAEGVLTFAANRITLVGKDSEGNMINVYYDGEYRGTDMSWLYE